MHASIAVAALGLVLAGPALAQTDPMVGHWTWNAARSTYTPPDPAPDRSETLNVTRADTRFAAAFDAISHTGEAYRLSWDAEVGGPAAPLTGGKPGDTIRVDRKAPGQYGFEITMGPDSMTRTCTAAGAVMTCEGRWTAHGTTYTFKETWDRN